MYAQHRFDWLWGSTAWRLGPNFEVFDGYYGYVIMTVKPGYRAVDFHIATTMTSHLSKHRYTDRVYSW